MLKVLWFECSVKCIESNLMKILLNQHVYSQTKMSEFEHFGFLDNAKQIKIKNLAKMFSHV